MKEGSYIMAKEESSFIDQKLLTDGDFEFAIVDKDIKGLTDEVRFNISKACFNVEVPHLHIEYDDSLKNKSIEITNKYWNGISVKFLEFENDGVLDFFYKLQEHNLTSPSLSTFTCEIKRYNNKHEHICTWHLEKCLICDIDEYPYDRGGYTGYDKFKDYWSHNNDKPRQFTIYIRPFGMVFNSARDVSENDYEVRIHVMERIQTLSDDGVSDIICTELKETLLSLLYSTTKEKREDVLKEKYNDKILRLILQSISTRSSITTSYLIEHGLFRNDVDTVFRSLANYLSDASSLIEEGKIIQSEFLNNYDLNMDDVRKIISCVPKF